jgi:hypothetical protein
MDKQKTDNFEEYTSWCYDKCLRYNICSRMLREGMFKRGEFPCPLFDSYDTLEVNDETTDVCRR